MKYILIFFSIAFAISSCHKGGKPPQQTAHKVLQAAFSSQATPNDTDDPAIWVHPTDPAQSLIIGTDKGDENGGIYVFDLEGKIDSHRSVTGIQRPNNVDVEYGMIVGDTTWDIAVATERGRNMIRVFRLPDMQAIDQGGLPVFEGDSLRAPMGIGLYKRPGDQAIFAYVSRKTGPEKGYIGIYQILADSNGKVGARFIDYRGAFSGKKEIEAICVDDSLGYLYYSDEMAGIRKYHADPDSSGEELAFWGGEHFTEDLEGISILATESGKGYLLVSDQQANAFQLFPREGIIGDPHSHPHLGTFYPQTIESDGSETTVLKLGRPFEKGLFVAMSDDRTFQFYQVDSLLKAIVWNPKETTER